MCGGRGIDARLDLGDDIRGGLTFGKQRATGDVCGQSLGMLLELTGNGEQPISSDSQCPPCLQFSGELWCPR